MKPTPRPTTKRLRIARCPNCEQIPTLISTRKGYSIHCSQHAKLMNDAPSNCITAGNQHIHETPTRAASEWNAKQRRNPKNPQRATATIQ